MPFVAYRLSELERLTDGISFQLNTPQWEFISDAAKDLVQKMLTTDHNHRITIHEVLNHKWLRDRDKSGTKIHLIETVEEMKKFNARRKLQVAVLAAVSSPKWNSFYSDPNSDVFSDYGEDEITSSGELLQGSQ